MSSTQLAYWRQGMIVGNLGDALNPWLMSQLGIGYERYRREPDTGDVLFAIGSVLDDFWLEPLLSTPGRRGVVWGSGVRTADASFDRSRLDVVAVRGPTTAKVLGVGHGVPWGDPGLLTAELWTGRSVERSTGGTVWVRQYDTNRIADVDLRALGCNEQVSMRVWNPVCDLSPVVGAPLRRISPFRIRREYERFRAGPLRALRSSVPGSLDHAIAAIAEAEFVLADSLHGAVIAESFGVPWAVHDLAADRVAARWDDWFGSFGLEPSFVADARAGARWHDRVRSQLDDFDLAPLRDSIDELRERLGQR